MPPNLQERLAGVVEHLEAGEFSATDARSLAGTVADLRALQARIEDALGAMHRGEWSIG